jgi:hypothetical protein
MIPKEKVQVMFYVMHVCMYIHYYVYSVKLGYIPDKLNGLEEVHEATVSQSITSLVASVSQ